jgi:hypothetical protein
VPAAPCLTYSSVVADRTKRRERQFPVTRIELAARTAKMDLDAVYSHVSTVGRRQFERYWYGHARAGEETIKEVARATGISADYLVGAIDEMRDLAWDGHERRADGAPTAPDGGTPLGEMPEPELAEAFDEPLEEGRREDPARREAGSA